ncbi:hypothetical protein DPMN_035560 [Dreissena polymorpha]|uniref:Uncharacterized protein n=1 Tax=Dreissena polymorpha TaxID=45954 RepID=A0A9D4M7S5_DREPO|nr:hypothetical protein DPMN_035560 [Dreissena polymorpha]
MGDALSSKIDSIAVDIEKRLSDKISKILDKRMSTESNRIKNEVIKEIGTVSDNICQDVKCLQQQNDEMKSVESS